jgi:hypothetical protein
MVIAEDEAQELVVGFGQTSFDLNRRWQASLDMNVQACTGIYNSLDTWRVEILF